MQIRICKKYSGQSKILIRKIDPKWSGIWSRISVLNIFVRSSVKNFGPVRCEENWPEVNWLRTWSVVKWSNVGSGIVVRWLVRENDPKLGGLAQTSYDWVCPPSSGVRFEGFKPSAFCFRPSCGRSAEIFGPLSSGSDEIHRSAVRDRPLCSYWKSGRVIVKLQMFLKILFIIFFFKKTSGYFFNFLEEKISNKPSIISLLESIRNQTKL